MMRKNSFLKRLSCAALAALMLLPALSACTDSTLSDETTPDTAAPAVSDTLPTETDPEAEAETDPPVVEAPSVSLDQLTFTPASPEGQVLTEKGNSPQIIIRNYNETATDALGRVLPTSAETGLPKEDKYVGLFYSLWTAETSAPVDNSKVMAVNPKNPNFGGRWGFCFWTEPETGYHKADDIWQIKRDMYYFAMAGVDFLYIDMTNGYLYEKSMTVFLDTCLELRAEGLMTPYIVPWCFGSNVDGSGDMGKFYDLFYCNEKYDDMWFYWEGKPLALIKPLDDGSYPILRDKELKNELTYRKAWTGSGRDYWVDNYIVNFEYGYGYTKHPDIAECVGIGCAGFANYGHGRSGALSAKKYLDQFWETDTMGQGLVLEDAFNQVMEKNPETTVLLLSRWNEWIAQNFTDPADRGTDTGFVDQFNAEFSRDMEPMKGGFTDNYFYQMCSIIRRFKGVLPADGASGKHTMTETDPDVFAAWESICPVYTDFKGDTSHRDSTDTTGKIQYVNTTGRNDIVESRITADGANLYVYARTAETITDYAVSPNWMLLFIDADADKTTGWEGYDFLVNYEVISADTTTLCAYIDGVWQEVGTVKYAVKADRLTVTIPRKALNLTGGTLKVNFHWMDNVTDIYDLESWFTTGDSAPERRNNYAADLAIPYTGEGENLLPARDGADRISGMPAVVLSDEEMSALKAGLKVTVYDLPASYEAQPDFRLIESLQYRMDITKQVSAEVLPFNSDVAAVFEGYVKVNESGSCTFELTYDDGAKLYIDGCLVVDGSYDKTADSGIKTASGSILLDAGYHTIRIAYAECNGGKDAHLSVTGDWAFYCAAKINWNVNLSQYEGAVTNASPIYFPLHSNTLCLGEVDLSKYTAVKITYGCDPVAAPGGLPIGLTTAKGTLGNRHKPDTSSAIAYALMEEVTVGWENGARTSYIDLSEVDYVGEIYVAMTHLDGHGFNIYAVEFVA